MAVVHRIHSTYDYDETPEEERSPDNEASRHRPTEGGSTQDPGGHPEAGPIRGNCSVLTESGVCVVAVTGRH